MTTNKIQPESLTLIKAKLIPPTLPNYLLSRDKFDDLIQESEPASLVLVQAPAGYGKTTVATDRLLGAGANCTWFRLDTQDNNSDQFAFYLAHTLNEGLKGSCPQTINLLQTEGYPSLQGFLTDLLSELPLEGEPLYLVLDDYHLINNPDIHEGIKFLLRHQPSYLTMVILSRTTPPIGIAQLRMQGRLHEITSKDLAFTADEAQQYFEKRLRYEVSRETIERANRRVEGWVSALQLLAATASTASDFSDSVEQLQEGNQYIFDYFDELVKLSVNEKQRSFLLRTSVLGRFNAFMVLQLAGQEDSQTITQ